jgi:signal transduction histidine kinase
MLRTTRRAAAQMNRLIGDLVDDARIEAGRLVIEFGVVDVGALLRTAEERYRPIAEKRGVELRIGPLEGPIRIRGDELRILQALGNLLDNAVKFTPAGGTVVLEASATSTAVALSVSDTGPGIADSDASRVWDRFWQARKSDPKGVGLGLAIVRGIVEAHGGRVLLESKVGVGSIFALTLPRSRAESGEF